MAEPPLYFSSAYQITQECPFKCPFCLRLYDNPHPILTQSERLRMVRGLKERGLKRLTITGGEPVILGDELFDFMRAVHEQQIHVSLSSTGFRLDRQRVMELDYYLDQLMISIHSLTERTWIEDFGDTRHTRELFETVTNLLQWVKTTGIILEVNTVVHRENAPRIVDLGWQLASLNPNIVWKINEYYSAGKESARRDRYELQADQFSAVRERVSRTFNTIFRRLRFREKETRAIARDLMISPAGMLVTTSDYSYGATAYNVVSGPLPPVFENYHSWSEYRKMCRDWGWGDLD